MAPRDVHDRAAMVPPRIVRGLVGRRRFVCVAGGLDAVLVREHGIAERARAAVAASWGDSRVTAERVGRGHRLTTEIGAHTLHAST